MKNLFLVLIGILGLNSPYAIADHTLPSGSCSRLGNDTQRLDYQVRYSSLRYPVKMAVSNFAYDVSRFLQCAHEDHRGHIDLSLHTRDHDLITDECEYYLHRVHESFYPVERYLYDTYYDYPNVYYSYLAVRNDLRKMHP